MGIQNDDVCGTAAETVKRPWVENVDPKCSRRIEGCITPTHGTLKYLETRCRGHLQAYPSNFRKGEATTINHVHRAKMLHHATIYGTTAIHLKTKIGKNPLTIRSLKLEPL
jgi:hypothetical protein